MLDFHLDKKRYFDMQYLLSRDHLIPFIEDHVTLDASSRVLEIGCAEAGVLKAFVEKSCQVTGIELLESRLVHAKNFMSSYIEKDQARFIHSNIYDIDPEKDLEGKFDLVILKDVIEHIPNQEKLIPYLKTFLKEGGHIFFAFPPWHMPFGGHQQICNHKLLQKIPWIHLLPRFIYKFILTSAGERHETVKELMELVDTGITIERMQSIFSEASYTVSKKKHWFINPIYKYKFGISARSLWPVLRHIPFVRNLYTTASYYLIY